MYCLYFCYAWNSKHNTGIAKYLKLSPALQEMHPDSQTVLVNRQATRQPIKYQERNFNRPVMRQRRRWKERAKKGDLIVLRPLSFT
ncbi:hypothetical protein PoB_003128700 [Plakobranchus ocellatus]|uniref:Uncharacterized protein n=1 Tax=Plakobranchus ocellatus TaxID=259542 RepID=A0AAV4ACX5_9GAST|nr:hypothetical protein PoB_003128700 [Plakobranchus ocellatus]